MSEVTQADRLIAEQIARLSVSWQEQAAEIAAALAAEREKARAALPEFQCPSCGATTRARMADQ